IIWVFHARLKNNVTRMNHPVKIKNALVSVYYKDNLAPLIKLLDKYGVTFYSTGGTEAFIREQGVDVVPVEDLTSYPSILGGRVKTLHPKVFGGILARRPLEGDQQQLAQYEIPEIDLVIVDLYPFEETVASGATEQDIIEKIDIGGISLIRAAAKNFNDVVIISSKYDYKELAEALASQEGQTGLEQLKSFAKRAFNPSSLYATAIVNSSYPTQSLPVVRQPTPHSRPVPNAENSKPIRVIHGYL